MIQLKQGTKLSGGSPGNIDIGQHVCAPLLVKGGKLRLDMNMIYELIGR